MVEKTCHHCGKVYTSRGNKYCSTKCRNVINARLKTKRERLKSPLIQFIIDYLPKHGYTSSKKIGDAYIKEHRSELYHQPDYQKQRQKIKLKIGGYFRTLSREGKYNIVKWNRSRPWNYKVTEGMIQGFRDLKNGAYFQASYDARYKFKIDLLNYDWRRWDDLEKNETLSYNGRENGKMHFLGTVDKVDPHFLELFNIQEPNI